MYQLLQLKLVYYLGKRNYFLVKVLTFLKKSVLKVSDPFVKSKIGNYELLMPLSHMLPIYKVENPFYDTAIGRISEFIYKKENRVINIIDVGANVGDTCAVIKSNSLKCKILCIEGNETFGKLLHENFKCDSDILVLNSFCSDSSQSLNASINSKAGTASITYSDENNERLINFHTLDTLFDNQQHINGVDLIKIDTDGFDYKVMRGAKNLIKKYKPFIFFELDKRMLLKNEENPISIFDLFVENNYSDILVYDNFGYLIGLFQLASIKNIEALINYFNSKNMYLDILVIPEHEIAEIINIEESKIPFNENFI